MSDRSPVVAVGTLHGAPALYILWREDEGRLASRDEFPDGGLAPRIVRGRGSTPGTVYVRKPGGVRPVRPDSVGVRWVLPIDYYELQPFKICDQCHLLKPNDVRTFDWSWAGPKNMAVGITGSMCTACRVLKLVDAKRRAAGWRDLR